MDRQDHRAVRVPYVTRVILTWRRARTGAVDARDQVREPRRLHARRPTWTRSRRAAGGRVAGRGDRTSAAAIPHRIVAVLDRKELEPHAGAEAVQPRRD